MRSLCLTKLYSPLFRAAAFVLALWLGQNAAALATEDIAGLYRHQGQIAAILEVAPDADRYVVTLEGGVPSGQGAATPADCVIEARGMLDGAVLRARFGPVDTDTFYYGAAAAEREGRVVQIAFEPGTANVLEADIMGYCPLLSDFSGRYRKVEKPPEE